MRGTTRRAGLTSVASERTPVPPLLSLPHRRGRALPAQPHLAARHGHVARHRGRLRHGRGARDLPALRPGRRGHDRARGDGDPRRGERAPAAPLPRPLRARPRRPRGGDEGGDPLARRPPDHRLPEDRAAQGDARVPGGRGPAGTLPPESLAADATRSSSASSTRWLPSARDRRDFRLRLPPDDRGPLAGRDPAHPRAGSRRRRAVRATCGFDGVELHFAHAYTMASFLSVTNGRTDAYGGSFENRMRLPREVIAAVREEVGREFLARLPLPGLGGHPGRGRRASGETRSRTPRGSALSWRGRGSTSCPSRGAASSRTRSSPPVGEAAYPYTGWSGRPVHPARQEGPGRGEYVSRHRDPKCGARSGLPDPGGHCRQDPYVRPGRVHPA